MKAKGHQSLCCLTLFEPSGNGPSPAMSGGRDGPTYVQRGAAGGTVYGPSRGYRTTPSTVLQDLELQSKTTATVPAKIDIKTESSSRLPSNIAFQMWTTIGESSNDTDKKNRHPGDPYMRMWVHVLAWCFLSGFSFMYSMDVWMCVWSHTKQEYGSTG